MKKILIILTLLTMLAGAVSCNEPETTTVSGEGTENIITENVIIEDTLT